MQASLSVVYRHLFEDDLTLLVLVWHWHHIFGHRDNVSEIHSIWRIINSRNLVFTVGQSLRIDVQMEVSLVILDGAYLGEKATPDIGFDFIFAIKVVTFAFEEISTVTLFQVFQQNLLEIFYHDLIALHPAFWFVALQNLVDRVALLADVEIGSIEWWSIVNYFSNFLIIVFQRRWITLETWFYLSIFWKE